jgi:hypothetical protein
MKGQARQYPGPEAEKLDDQRDRLLRSRASRRSLDLSTAAVGRRRSDPDGVSIVLSATTEADSPGATVFVPAQRGDDGALAAGFVVVGTNGVDPPM